jgi:hypothetical protein
LETLLRRCIPTDGARTVEPAAWIEFDAEAIGTWALQMQRLFDHSTDCNPSGLLPISSLTLWEDPARSKSVTPRRRPTDRTKTSTATIQPHALPVAR